MRPLRIAAPLTFGVLALGVLAFGSWATRPLPPLPGPETVEIAARPFAYRPAGDFHLAGAQADPALQHITPAQPLLIMKYPVAAADYARCVAAGKCLRADAPTVPGALPQTGVNWIDAHAYASWLSARTGQHWRLPSDAEWQRAAAERFFDDGVEAASLGDPAQRWLATYSSRVRARGVADPALRPLGSFGENTLGVADLAGNIWEWTDSCDATGELDAQGAILSARPYCGVRIAEGKHRAFIIDFVRDAKSGGCGAGVPPDYLGFRLVRED
ncbi:formylglycine-generating enzyme family protein [Phaeovulum sp. W22_SRMD_FR3]|uniref:formylglycine-generating enzyme family protein n=1 Tax=Phaeovulum sp. W22_SRMD_FR3 TaxID=3240274 RepID=UPI003F978822